MWAGDNMEMYTESFHNLVVDVAESVLSSDTECDTEDIKVGSKYSGVIGDRSTVIRTNSNPSSNEKLDTLDPKRILEESNLRPDAPVFNGPSVMPTVFGTASNPFNRKPYSGNPMAGLRKLTTDPMNKANMSLPVGQPSTFPVLNIPRTRPMDPPLMQTNYQPQFDITALQRLQYYQLMQHQQQQQIRCLQYPILQQLQKNTQMQSIDDLNETMTNLCRYQQSIGAMIGASMNQNFLNNLENTMESNDVAHLNRIKANIRLRSECESVSFGGNGNQNQRRSLSGQGRTRRLTSTGSSNRVGCNHTTAQNSFCNFCKKNGEPLDFYSSHTLKSGDKTVCPVLRECICSLCNEKGHTMSHCDLNKKKDTVLKMINKHNAMQI